jgi:hypothetical protein
VSQKSLPNGVRRTEEKLQMIVTNESYFSVIHDLGAEFKLKNNSSWKPGCGKASG